MQSKDAGRWGIATGILGIVIFSPWIIPIGYSLAGHIIATFFCFEAPGIFIYNLFFPINPTEDIPDFLTLGQFIIFLISPLLTLGLFYGTGYMLHRLYLFITKK